MEKVQYNKKVLLKKEKVNWVYFKINIKNIKNKIIKLKLLVKKEN